MRKDDSGATSVEKVGTVAVAAVVVLGVLLAIPGTPVSTIAARAACEVRQAATGGGGGCEDPADAPRTDEDYEPVNCKIREESETAGYEVVVAFISIGEEYGFLRQEFSDGTVRLTVVDSASVGVEFGGGAKFDLGKLADGSKKAADVDVGGGLEFGYGTTWTFEDSGQEEEFRDEIDKYLIQQQQMRTQGAAGIAIYNSIAGEWADPPDPNITFASTTLDASLTGALGIEIDQGTTGSDGGPQYIDPNIGADFTIAGDYKVLVEEDSDKGTRSWTYQISGTAEGGLSGGVAEVSGGGTSTGAIKVTRNEEGELVQMRFISTREGSAEFTAGLTSPVAMAARAIRRVRAPPR